MGRKDPTDAKPSPVQLGWSSRSCRQLMPERTFQAALATILAQPTGRVWPLALCFPASLAFSWLAVAAALPAKDVGGADMALTGWSLSA